MEPREIKGLEIAAKNKLTRQGKSNLWLVPSQTNKQEKYTVALDDEKPSCTCRDHEFTRSSASRPQTVRPSQPRRLRLHARPTRRIGPRTMPRRRKKNRGYRLCCMNYAERFLSLSNGAEGRVYHWQTLSLPARSRFTQPFQADAFRVICRKQNDAAFCQRCPLTIQCSDTWKPKPSRLTCTN